MTALTSSFNHSRETLQYRLLDLHILDFLS